MSGETWSDVNFPYKHEDIEHIVMDDLLHEDPASAALTARGFERINDPRKQALFILAFQDDALRITKIISGNSYDALWNQGTEEAKVNGGFWSIFDNLGRFVDGNVTSR